MRGYLSAAGCPDRKVIVLDGDGSLLMNLGSLVTIGHAAPRNLIHCVGENGTYETNRSCRVRNIRRISAVSIASSPGMPSARRCKGDFLDIDSPILKLK